jgi:hypothetical protein
MLVELGTGWCCRLVQSIYMHSEYIVHTCELFDYCVSVLFEQHLMSDDRKLTTIAA